MNKLFIFLSLTFLLIFVFRVYQIGGLSPVNTNLEFETVTTYFAPINQALGERMDQLLPEPQVSLLKGMVLGIQSSFLADFKKALQNTSTIHIVVVSGQNLTMLAGFIMSLASLFGRKKTAFLTLLVILFYAFLTGFQVPVIRAAIMILFTTIGQFFGRDSDSVWILGLTGGLMLIINPNWLLSISFQLSFLATFGVVVVAPELIKYLGFLPEIIRQDFGVSLAAQLLTWPVIAANFYQFSLLAVLVNTLVLWTVSFIMIGGLIALAVSFINLYLGQIAALFPGILLTFFVYIINFFNQKWAVLTLGTIPFIAWIGYYFLILSMLLILKKHNKQNDPTQIARLNPII